MKMSMTDVTLQNKLIGKGGEVLLYEFIGLGIFDSDI